MDKLTAPYRPTPMTSFPDMVDRFFRDTFVRPFEPLFDGLRVSANLLETDETYIVQIVVPGISDVSSLTIQVTGRQLTLRGTTEIPTFEGATYIYCGLEGQEFSEMFTLPSDVNGEKAVADYHAGILTITLPKAEYAKPHTIKVTVPKT